MTFTNFLRNRARSFLLSLSFSSWNVEPHMQFGGQRGPLYYINNRVFAGSSSTFGTSFDEKGSSKNAKRRGRNSVSGYRKTMNNRSSRGLYPCPLCTPFSRSLLFSLHFYLLLWDIWLRKDALQKKKGHASAPREDVRDGREWEKRERAMNTAAKNAISCRECQAEWKQIEWTFKIIRQSSQTVHPGLRVFQYVASIGEKHTTVPRYERSGYNRRLAASDRGRL